LADVIYVLQDNKDLRELREHREHREHQEHRGLRELLELLVQQALPENREFLEFLGHQALQLPWLVHIFTITYPRPLLQILM
jgi:hypothetical protein